MLVLAIELYVISVAASLLILYGKNKRTNELFYYPLPVAFILAESLYVLPLSLHSVASTTAEGNISPFLPMFIDSIPSALVLCALFNVVFSISYRFTKYSNTGTLKLEEKNKKPIPLNAAISLLIVSIAMIYQLTAEVGGILNLVLLGYKVTEQLSSAGHYAIAFDWLVVISLVVLYSGYAEKSKLKTIAGYVLIVILIGMFAIMGRRAVLVVLVGATLIGYHIIVKKIPMFVVVAIISFCFVALNYIGLIRGESYQNVNEIANVVSEKNNRLQDDSPGLFYAVTTGNFAVPFETFPQIIRTFGDKYWPGFGLYSLRAITFSIPAFIWDDRPLPLANWYVSVFYGETERNIGRQFFILTAPYMDFGPLGVLAFAYIIAKILRSISQVTSNNKDDPLVSVFFALFLGNVLNFVANDALGFLIVFMKSNGIPLLIFYYSRKLKKLKIK
jgi:oligosaccharide repeat unit polymerase